MDTGWVWSVYLGTVFVAVDLLVAEVILVGEVGLERQMLFALAALEALLVEDDLVHRSNLLDLVDAVAAPRALVRRRRNEKTAKPLGRRVRHRDRRRRRKRRHLSRRHC